MNLKRIFEMAAKGEEDYWLDFKAKFDFDSDKHRAELVKDISALANTVDTTGYLIIGVDCSGETTNYPGFNETYDDAKLQQIVNTRLNKPVSFSYDRFEYDGNTYGCFAVPYSDVKPHQISKNVDIKENGEKKRILSEGQVFIREGSSTRFAKIEEIIEMSLNAVNDLSKIEEDDLAARVMVLLRRGDYVGIRELLRNAPRPLYQLIGYINSQAALHRAFIDNRGKLEQLIISHSRRITSIGFAIIRHRCVECYYDLFNCIARFYLVGNETTELRGRDSGYQTWHNILILGGFVMAVRNWDFIISLLQYRTWTQEKDREYLILHFLNPEKGGTVHPSFERLYYSPTFIEEFECDKERYMIHLSEFDLLAYIFSKVIKGTYLPSWQCFIGPWKGRLFEEITANTAMRDFLCIHPGVIGLQDLENMSSQTENN